MRLVGELPRVEERVYAELADGYALTLSRLDGVLGAYRYGGRAPGISDLDLLCVVRDDLRSDTVSTLRSAMPCHELVRHPACIVPESLCSSIAPLLCLRSLEQLWISPRIPGLSFDPVDAGMARAHLLELCLDRFVSSAAQLQSDPVHRREAVSNLSKLERGEELFEMAGLAVPESLARAAADVRGMKSGFASQDGRLDDTALRDLTRSAVEVWRGAFDSVLAHSMPELESSRPQQLPRPLAFMNRRIRFVPGSNTLRMNFRVARILGYARDYLSLDAPIELAAWYSAARMLPRHEKRSSSAESPLEESLVRRTAQLISHRRFIVERGITSVHWPGAFPYFERRRSLLAGAFDRLFWAFDGMGDANIQHFEAA